MRDAHSRIRRIHRLSARARRAEGVDAKVFGLDLDVHVFGFGQHGNRHRRSVYATLLLGRGHALHAMHAAFVLQCANRRRWPSMMAITSFSPPTPDSEVESTSTFQRCVSA